MKKALVSSGVVGGGGGGALPSYLNGGSKISYARKIIRAIICLYLVRIN